MAGQIQNRKSSLIDKLGIVLPLSIVAAVTAFAAYCFISGAKQFDREFEWKERLEKENQQILNGKFMLDPWSGAHPNYELIEGYEPKYFPEEGK